MLTIIIVGAITYVVGAIFWYGIDGWVDWSGGSDDDLIFCTLLWPLFCWLIIGDLIRRKLRSMKQAKLEREKEERRVRIAAQKEIEKIEAELDCYITPKRKAR